MRRVLEFLAVMLVVCFAYTGVATNVSFAAEKPIKWRCQCLWPMASPSFPTSALTLSKKIEERTGGKLQIEMFAAGSLMPSKEIFKATKMGMLEMGAVAPEYFITEIPLGEIGSGIPFNFKDTWECVYFYRWLGFEDLLRKACAEHGVYYATDSVFSTELVTTKQVDEMNDFKGLKLRSAGSMQSYFASVGAAANYIPGSEVYSALSSGVIDGAHWGNALGNDSMKLYEIGKFHLKTPLRYSGVAGWIINMKALEKLPEDIREIVINTLNEEFWKKTNQYEYMTAKKINELEKAGVKMSDLSEDEFNKMQKAALPIWDRIAGEHPYCAEAIEKIKKFNKSMGRLQ
jgi:TRAP-type mannitol/chloroaromatic compound transport system substrate-binding protein